jgi:hypothetical protein
VTYHANPLWRLIVARRFSNKSNAGRFLNFHIPICALWTFVVIADDGIVYLIHRVRVSTYIRETVCVANRYTQSTQERLTNMIAQYTSSHCIQPAASQFFLTSVPFADRVGTLVANPVEQTSRSCLT